MVEFPFMNIALAFVGIWLITLLISGKAKNNLFLRTVFVIYFLVVMQYNHERIWYYPNYLILTGAGILLGIWSLKSRQSEELS
jgi:hypothetical protein